MVAYSTALHFPALGVMSVPGTSVLHLIVTHVIVTENCGKYRYRSVMKESILFSMMGTLFIRSDKI